MANRIGRTLGKKLQVGRMGIPLWTVGLAGVLTVAAAGQAVGPVLTGSTSGSVNLTVAQAVTLDTDMGLGTNPGTAGADDAVTTRTDEGTGFTVAMELNVGQRVYTCVYVQNQSGADASTVLELSVPAGIDVEVEQFSSTAGGAQPCSASMSDDGVTQEAQLSPQTWLAMVGKDAGVDNNDGLRATIEPKDDLKPGCYTISGRLVQISG